MNNFKKSKVSCLLILAILFTSFGPIMPSKVQAQWIVSDPITEVNTGITAAGQITANTKEYGLDAIAFIIANAIIQRMAASTVKWINTGFKGSPAFVTNPSQYFGNLGNGIAGQLIYNNPDTRFMCAPFKFKVQIALTNSYRNLNQFQCTLTGVVSNFDNFMSDFNQGGWDGFIQVTQNSQNNPIGLYNTWNNQILNEQNNKLQQKQNELNQGRGFLSFQKCTKYAGSVTPKAGGSATQGTKRMVCDQYGDASQEFKCLKEREVTEDSSGNLITTEDIGPGIEGACLKTETQTPGSVIQGQLDNVLSSGNNRINVADEINEIISSLLNQLVSHVVGGIGNGLRSMSGSGPSNNNKTYTTQLENDATNQSTLGGSNSCVIPGGTQLGKFAVDGVTCMPADTQVGTRCTDLAGEKGKEDLAGNCIPDPTKGQTCNDPTTGASGKRDGWGDCIATEAPPFCSIVPVGTACEIDDPATPGSKIKGKCAADRVTCTPNAP